jgi:FlaA1/EpsC-like NDP-sugar epimerase
MTHKQHPIGSGFTAAATADDVLAGIDLTGKNVIVTGGHAGIGLEVATICTSFSCTRPNKG